jgi:CheY-like chemotaxis protein
MALPTLIVIGDDASFRYLIRRYADKSACRVVFVDVLAEDILDVVQHEAPGVVMVEFDFPDDQGQRVVSALKAHPATQQIPVIVCSWSEEAEWRLEDDAAVYLQKPILYDDFRAALSNVVTGHQS